MPAPTEQRTSLSPGWRLSSTSIIARGMLALEVLPTLSTLRKKRSKRDAAALGGRLEDPAVGLVRNDPAGLARRSSRSWRWRRRMMSVKLSVAKRNRAWPSMRIQGSTVLSPLRIAVARLVAAGHVQAAGVGAEDHLADAVAGGCRRRRSPRRPRRRRGNSAAVRRVQEPRLHVDAHGRARCGPCRRGSCRGPWRRRRASRSRPR